VERDNAFYTNELCKLKLASAEETFIDISYAASYSLSVVRLNDSGAALYFNDQQPRLSTPGSMQLLKPVTEFPTETVSELKTQAIYNNRLIAGVTDGSTGDVSSELSYLVLCG